MNWINHIIQRLFSLNKRYQVDSQQKLVLLVTIPSFFITAISLFIAQISPYLIAFILIVLFLVCSYAIVASKQYSEYQIRTLSNLIESMIDGDYTLRGRLKTNQAYQELLSLINNLADTLSKHKIEAKESRLLLERIMEQMDAMVIAIDEQGYVVMANASAHKLIFENVEKLFELKLIDLAIGHQIMTAQSGIVEFKKEKQEKQKYLSGEHFLFKESFLSEGEKHQLFMLTSAERLLMEKERKAWQSLLRVLSHEMNNSLTPIAAISQSMQKKLQQGRDEINLESLNEGASIINERADSLSHFIASYSQLSHLPRPNKTSFLLVELIENIAGLFPKCQVHCNILIDQKLVADKQQFEQIFINLFKNAQEAMEDSDKKLIEISYNQQDKWQQVTVTDYGKGIANFDNLFVPFYTTKTQGSGIGLALCRQIMFNHDGLIHIVNREDESGVEAVLSLPNTEPKNS